MNEEWVEENSEERAEDRAEGEEGAPLEGEAVGTEESLIAEEPEDRYAPPADAVKTYLRDIRRSTLLTFKDEVMLAKKIAKGDEAARHRMIESNLRLVVSIGKRY
ncbi:MAG TPA: sigma-70 factor domain-containing protein, partial [Candidatus Manganitrophaceae bacterium]|nr:sigma-70 factor domain-containing protein [Candidatus Manganitrophaceae bacterium]